jgi:hypothetical protein
VATASDAPPASPLASFAGPTPGDAQRIAALLYGADLSPEDAEKIAAGAAGTLANLKYLALLKSDDVATPFGYPVTLAEAARES